MHRLLIHRLLPALAAASLTVACGTVLRVAGIEGTGDSNGSASGYGSLFVNGREFDTSQAEFLLNGEAVSEADIAIGMLTSVQGDLPGERADRIVARRTLLAPIDGIARVGEARSASLSILGQNVRVDEMTRLVGISLDELGSNMLVDVHALTPATGTALATYLEVADPAYTPGGQTLTLTGFIDTLSATELEMGSLTVDIASATIDEAIAVGDRVVIHGQQPARGGTLFATTVTIAADTPVPETYADRSILVESVNGSLVRSGQTEIDLATAQRLDNADQSVEPGVQLLARGPVDASGLLTAVDYRVIPEPEVILSGTIASDSHQLLVLDQALEVLPITQFIESRPGEPRQLSLASLQLGDTVTLVGYHDRDDKLVTTRVERRAAGLTPTVYGFLLDLTAGLTSNNLVIGGVEIITDDDTVYETVGGTEISETVFLATATIGVLVQAWGVELPGETGLRATRIRLLN